MNRSLDAALLQSWIAEEIKLSDSCAQPATAQIHRKIAALYSDRLSALQVQEPNIAKCRAVELVTALRSAAGGTREVGNTMGNESEIDYLIRRTGEELDLADDCRDANVASIHRQMAVAYAERVAG